MPEIPVVIAVPAHMSSVLRDAVVDRMRKRFPGLTVTLEEQAVLIPRFGRFSVNVDSASKMVIDFAPSTITRYLASAFPLVRTGQRSDEVKAHAREVARGRNLGETSKESRAPSREHVCALARQYWEEEGRPEGRAEEHWMRAEAQLRAGNMSHSEVPNIPRRATNRG